MSDLREYIVTLESYDDLDQFYDDMETEGGNLYIPNRSVDLLNRRPVSRNTHYLLSDEEAEILRQDSRVQHVTLNYVDQGLEIKPANHDYLLTTQMANGGGWVKSKNATTPTLLNTHLNWGVLRCTEGVPRVGWGNDNVTGSFYDAGNATAYLTNVGRNVDVVIIDGIIDPNHPEYKQSWYNAGLTRVIRYNWYQHNPVVTGSAAGTYDYDAIFNNAANIHNNDHGTHCAGTVAGNTLGWARAANIYNYYAYSDYNCFDYIREFHKNKSINSTTKIKNPTICNCSFVTTKTHKFDDISQIRYRGTFYDKPAGGWTDSIMATYGVWSIGSYTSKEVSSVYRYAPFDADVLDAVKDGIIIVGAAGNDGMYESLPNSIDYNNALIDNGTAYFYHQGASPACAIGSITVGAVGAQQAGDYSGAGNILGHTISEPKAYYSNTGPRVNIYAPGSQIMSAYISDGVTDSRNSSYKLYKIDGTSMATPQVTGVLACMLEIYPHANYEDALNYLMKFCSTNQIYDVSVYNFDNWFSLRGGPNKYLRYNYDRKRTGLLHPNHEYAQFRSSEVRYPKSKIRRGG
jgi:subtilisin family serine protease